MIATEYSSLRIIVADNRSTDDSLSFVRSRFPNVEILELKENYGFAKGYNEALRQIKSEFFVLLNSDVEVRPDWLGFIMQLFASDRSLAACQPKILLQSNKSQFEYAGAAGGWIDHLGYPFSRGRIFEHCETDQGQYDSDQDIFWASGAALVIRSELFFRAGGFDEYLFAHQEEIDLCWRLQLLGYKIKSCPASEVYHVGGGTLPRGNSRKTFLNYRNNLIILWKNLPVPEKSWKVPLRITLDQVSAVRMLAGGDGGYFLAVVKAHLAFVKWLLFTTTAKIQSKKRKLSGLKGVYRGSVVWAHFIKKINCFSDLDQGRLPK